MKLIRRILTGAALTIAASGLVSANTIGYTTSFPVGGVDPNTDFNYTLTLPKFDTLGGLYNLQSATIYFFVQEDVTSVRISNLGTNPQNNFAITANSNVVSDGLAQNGHMTNSATAADIYNGETLTLFDNVGGIGVPSSGLLTLGPGVGVSAVGACGASAPSLACSSKTYTGISDTNIGDPNFGGTVGTGILGVTGAVRNATVLANYIGSAATFTLAGGTYGFNTVGGGGSVSATVISTGHLTAEIDYNYTISGAPEPTTMLLVGSALVGLGFLRKRVKL